MSQENAQIVRDSVHRFANGNLTGLAELYAPNITIVAPPGWPEGGRFEGRVAVIGQLRRVQEDWAEQTMEITREKAEGDWVVHEILWTVQGAGSGVSSQVGSRLSALSGNVSPRSSTSGSGEMRSKP